MRLLAVVLLLFLGAGSGAQEWHRDRAGTIRIHCRPQNVPALQWVKPVLHQALDHISFELQTGSLDSVDLYLAPDRQTFRALTRGRIPEWGAGCAVPVRGRIFIHLEQRDPEALKRTLVHELAHVALFRQARGARLPRWFDEGLAMWLAREWQHRQSLDLALAVLADQVHSLDELEALLTLPESEARRAYAESFSAVLFLVKMGGPGTIPELLEAVGPSGSFDQALVAVVGLGSRGFNRAWQGHVRQEFNPLRLLLDANLLWLGILGLAALAFVITRLRARRLARVWEEEEEAGISLD